MSAGGSSQGMAVSGPPYRPNIAILGGQPTVKLDDPICACLLLLYVAGAATNMTIFQINMKRDHKFIFSALLFGFCMARITTLVLRIVWASYPTNPSIAIAANILVQAGVLLLFIVNLIFTQRMIRSYHPRFGWTRGLSLAFNFLYFCVIALLVMVITATVDSFFTLNMETRKIDRDIQLFAGTFLALLAFLPVPVTLLAIIVPRSQRPERFGRGHHRTKIYLLLFTSLLLSLGACFRIGVNYTTPRPADDPAWFHSKACFYCFNFAIELVVVYTYAISRFDRRFHVPNGSSGPGHYSGAWVNDTLKSSAQPVPMAGSLGLNREVDVFGDGGMSDNSTEQSRRAVEWEAKAQKELDTTAV